MATPSRSEFVKQWPMFSAWLVARGASMLMRTNGWELARWTGDGQTSVVYFNARHNITFTGAAEAAWIAFRGGKPFRVAPAAKRAGGKASPRIKALYARDGDRCFYCNTPVVMEDASVEHLVSVTHGGPSHMSNFVLAHQQCNAGAGHISAMEKIAIHIAALNKPAETRVQPE